MTMRVMLLCLTGMVSMLGAQRLNPRWVNDYDYHTTGNAVSPIALAMGGINLTNAGDYFASYDNPALLANNQGTAAATSFIIKNDEPLSLSQLVDAKTLLRDKQFMYYTLVAKQSAFTYQPVAAAHVSNISATTSEYLDYQLDKLQLSLAAKDDRYPDFMGGLNLKYLSGRLVKLSMVQHNGVWTPADNAGLIDDKVKGFSTDIGAAYRTGKYLWGVTFYDVLSHLWWENYDSASLKRRAAAGVQYSNNNLSLVGTVEAKMSTHPETTYHLGLIRTWNWGRTDSDTSSPDTGVENAPNQGLVLRAGLFSKNFDGTDNINYTLGSGYNYKMFRVDFALTNAGMVLRDSKYLFSVGMGF